VRCIVVVTSECGHGTLENYGVEGILIRMRIVVEDYLSYGWPRAVDILFTNYVALDPSFSKERSCIFCRHYLPESLSKTSV
jgi:hypothetical protein